MKLEMSEEVSREIRELFAQIDELKQELKHRANYQDRQIERLYGVIDGLKVAIRCNGVSGGEVKE